MTNSLRTTVTLVLLAGILFSLVFSGVALRWTSFWWAMSGSILLLTLAALAADPGLRAELRSDLRQRPLEKAAAGLLTAVLLYFVFWLGKHAALQLIPSAAGGIFEVYNLKTGTSPWQVAALMVLVFGPGEEIFWRGFVQKHFCAVLGLKYGVGLSVLLYGLVHVVSANLMLLTAALVCGAFWAGLFAWKRSLTINIVSHTAWDITIFLIWPLS